MSLLPILSFPHLFVAYDSAVAVFKLTLGELGQLGQLGQQPFLEQDLIVERHI